MAREIGIGGIALGMWLAAAATAGAADRQIRPYVATTFGGATTFVDLEDAVGHPHLTIGVNAAVLGELVGVDVDLGHSFGFFQHGDAHLVLASSVTTLTGNVVLAAPRRFTEYYLRPYLVAGAGLMRVRTQDYFGVFPIAEVMPAIDFGAGALDFVTDRVGLSWEVRRFQSVGNTTGGRGVFAGSQKLSFWRASMALAFRY